jgi:hypothetical protein
VWSLQDFQGFLRGGSSPLKLTKDSSNTLDCSHYVEHQILQENELRAHLRDMKAIYTSGMITTRMFYCDPVNVEHIRK